MFFTFCLNPTKCLEVNIRFQKPRTHQMCPKNNCERSRAKRGELAERRLSSRKRESSCTGIWENKTIEYFENEAYLKYGSYNKKYVFSPTESISEVNRPDPARPDHDAN